MNWNPFKISTLSFKLSLVIILAFMVLLVVIVLVFNTTMRDLTLRTGQNRLTQETALLQGFISQLDRSSLANTKILISKTDLIQTLDSQDPAAIREEVLKNSTFFEFEGVNILDSNGRRLVDTSEGATLNEDKLLSLALLGIETSGFVIDETGQDRLRLASVSPLKNSQGKIVAGILVSRDINQDLLKQQSLLSRGVEFAFIHNNEIVEETKSHVAWPLDQNAIQQAANGQTVLGNEIVTVDNVPYAVGYVPLQVGGEVGLVVMILFDLTELMAFQNQLGLEAGYFLVGLVVVLVVVITLFVRQNVTLPLGRLQQVAQKIASGDYTRPLLSPTGHDEISHLISTFNTMVAGVQSREAELRHLTETLQQRSNMIEASMQISQQLTSILEIDRLLQQVVIAIQKRFNYYHVHIYIIDQNTGELVMREGTGEVGQKLKTKGHHLQVGQGIVGRVAESRQPILADNVDEIASFVRNPLLPKTRSELAVPLRRANVVLGVLDIQSENIGGFSQEDLLLMQSIADQVAVAVENARLFRQARSAAAEAEALSRRLTHEAWYDIGQHLATSGYIFTKSELAPIHPAAAESTVVDPHLQPLIVDAVYQKKLITHVDNDSNSQSTCVSVPLILRDEVIGVIAIERAPVQTPGRDGSQPAREQAEARPWTEDELIMIRTAAEQVTLALDTARLARETQRAAWRDRIVGESTAKVWASTEVEEVMKAAVAQLGNQLKASEVIIRLGKEDELLPKSGVSAGDVI